MRSTPQKKHRGYGSRTFSTLAPESAGSAFEGITFRVNIRPVDLLLSTSRSCLDRCRCFYCSLTGAVGFLLLRGRVGITARKPAFLLATLVDRPRHVFFFFLETGQLSQISWYVFMLKDVMISRKAFLIFLSFSMWLLTTPDLRGS